MTEKMTQGQRIRRMRLEKRYTQDYVAAQLGTTKQAVYKYEADIVKNIPQDKLLRLAQLFGCSPAWLQGLSDDYGVAPVGSPEPPADGYGVPHRSKSDPAIQADDQFVFYRNLMDITLRLTPQDCTCILQFARFLLSQHAQDDGDELPSPPL